MRNSVGKCIGLGKIKDYSENGIWCAEQVKFRVRGERCRGGKCGKVGSYYVMKGL